MANLTIRNPPDRLYARLKDRAAENRRSINSEATLALERALTESGRANPARLLAELRRGRGRLKGLYLTDKDLRAGRVSGRK